MDGDPTNELQLLSISNDTIYLSQGNYVKLPEAFDWQYSSLIGVPTDVSYFNNDAGYLSEEYQALEDVLMINNDAGNRKIRNVDNPEYPKDVATKEYVDNIMNILDNNNLTVVDFIVSNSLFFYENEPVEFVDISLIEPISWQWDFGDGGTSILQNPNHIYETTGTYVVSLTASNEILSYTKQKEIYFHLFECGDTFEDEFSNTFETVLIGNQCWLKQNLNVDYDSQGNIVSKTCYNNDVQNCEIFGGLYSWNEIMNGYH